jgi:hypothetical protein
MCNRIRAAELILRNRPKRPMVLTRGERRLLRSSSPSPRTMLRLFQRLGRASEINLMGDNGSRRPGQTTCPNIASSQLILAATGSARKMSSARTIKKPSNKRCGL